MYGNCPRYSRLLPESAEDGEQGVTNMKRFLYLAGTIAITFAAVAGADTQPSLLGAACDSPVTEVSNNGLDDDGDGLIDCLDTDWSADGVEFVCSPSGSYAPACQPLLDDPAKIKFKADPRLDSLNLAARVLPTTAVDILSEGVEFKISNINGWIYSEIVLGSSFLSNTRGNKWKYKMKKNGTPQIFNVNIKQKFDKVFQADSFIVKIKLEGDLSNADPDDPINELNSLYDLDDMYMQVTLGDDVFFLDTTWERKKYGWYLSDKYMSTL